MVLVTPMKKSQSGKPMTDRQRIIRQLLILPLMLAIPVLIIAGIPLVIYWEWFGLIVPAAAVLCLLLVHWLDPTAIDVPRERSRFMD